MKSSACLCGLASGVGTRCRRLALGLKFNSLITGSHRRTSGTTFKHDFFTQRIWRQHSHFAGGVVAPDAKVGLTWAPRPTAFSPLRNAGQTERLNQWQLNAPTLAEEKMQKLQMFKFAPVKSCKFHSTTFFIFHLDSPAIHKSGHWFSRCCVCWHWVSCIHWFSVHSHDGKRNWWRGNSSASTFSPGGKQLLQRARWCHFLSSKPLWHKFKTHLVFSSWIISSSFFFLTVSCCLLVQNAVTHLEASTCSLPIDDQTGKPISFYSGNMN